MIPSFLKALFKKEKIGGDVQKKIWSVIHHTVTNPSSGLTAAQEERVQFSIGGSLPYQHCKAYRQKAVEMARLILCQNAKTPLSES